MASKSRRKAHVTYADTRADFGPSRLVQATAERTSKTLEDTYHKELANLDHALQQRLSTARSTVERDSARKDYDFQVDIINRLHNVETGVLRHGSGCTGDVMRANEKSGASLELSGSGGGTWNTTGSPMPWSFTSAETPRVWTSREGEGTPQRPRLGEQTPRRLNLSAMEGTPPHVSIESDYFASPEPVPYRSPSPPHSPNQSVFSPSPPVPPMLKPSPVRPIPGSPRQHNRHHDTTLDSFNTTPSGTSHPFTMPSSWANSPSTGGVNPWVGMSLVPTAREEVKIRTIQQRVDITPCICKFTVLTNYYLYKYYNEIVGEERYYRYTYRNLIERDEATTEQMEAAINRAKFLKQTDLLRFLYHLYNEIIDRCREKKIRIIERRVQRPEGGAETQTIEDDPEDSEPPPNIDFNLVQGTIGYDVYQLIEKQRLALYQLRHENVEYSHSIEDSAEADLISDRHRAIYMEFQGKCIAEFDEVIHEASRIFVETEANRMMQSVLIGFQMRCTDERRAIEAGRDVRSHLERQKTEARHRAEQETLNASLPNFAAVVQMAAGGDWSMAFDPQFASTPKQFEESFEFEPKIYSTPVNPGESSEPLLAAFQALAATSRMNVATETEGQVGQQSAQSSGLGGLSLMHGTTMDSKAELAEMVHVMGYTPLTLSGLLSSSCESDLLEQSKNLQVGALRPGPVSFGEISRPAGTPTARSPQHGPMAQSPQQSPLRTRSPRPEKSVPKGKSRPGTPGRGGSPRGEASSPSDLWTTQFRGYFRPDGQQILDRDFSQPGAGTTLYREDYDDAVVKVRSVPKGRARPGTPGRAGSPRGEAASPSDSWTTQFRGYFKPDGQQILDRDFSQPGAGTTLYREDYDDAVVKVRSVPKGRARPRTPGRAGSPRGEAASPSDSWTTQFRGYFKPDGQQILDRDFSQPGAGTTLYQEIYDDGVVKVRSVPKGKARPGTPGRAQSPQEATGSPQDRSGQPMCLIFFNWYAERAVSGMVRVEKDQEEKEIKKFQEKLANAPTDQEQELYGEFDKVMEQLRLNNEKNSNEMYDQLFDVFLELIEDCEKQTHVLSHHMPLIDAKNGTAVARLIVMHVVENGQNPMPESTGSIRSKYQKRFRELLDKIELNPNERQVVVTEEVIEDGRVVQHSEETYVEQNEPPRNPVAEDAENVILEQVRQNQALEAEQNQQAERLPYTSEMRRDHIVQRRLQKQSQVSEAVNHVAKSAEFSLIEDQSLQERPVPPPKENRRGKPLTPQIPDLSMASTPEALLSRTQDLSFPQAPDQSPCDCTCQTTVDDPDAETDDCFCMCERMLPTLQNLREMESSEQCEMFRSLRRWQIARRDIIASMGRQKKADSSILC